MERYEESIIIKNQSGSQIVGTSQRERERLRGKRRREEKKNEWLSNGSKNKCAQAAKRKQWRIASKKYYHSKLAKNQDRVNAEENAEIRRKIGKRLLRRNRDQEKNLMSNLNSRLSKQKRITEKWRKKYIREVKKRNQVDSESPAGRALNVIKSGTTAVQKELIFGEILKDKIKRHGATDSDFVKMLKKYRMVNRIHNEGILTRYRQKQAVNGRTNKEKRLTRVAKIKREIGNFFKDDSNAFPSPSKKDTITRKKEKMAKRYMTASCKELHQKFMKTTKLQISYSTFTRYKPFWVVALDINKRDTCLCSHHANFQFKLKKAQNVGLISYTTTSEFLSKTCCDIKSKACVFGTCDKCAKKKQIPKDLLKPFKNFDVFYQQWILREEERKTSKGNDIKVKLTTKEKVYCSTGELLEKISDELPKFSLHCFNIHHQQNFFNFLKNNMTETEAAIMIDWSENWICKCAEEVHSAHFGASKKQIALHTGVVYVRKGGKSESTPFCSVSSCLRHDASAIWAHLLPVLKNLRKNHPTVKTLHFISDGPTTQYRNKTYLYLLQSVCTDMGFDNGTQNYSEKGHGKGPPDGIGAAIKRKADEKVAQGNDITSSHSLVDAVKGLKVELHHIEENDIIQVDKKIPKGLTAIPGTMKLKQLAWNKANTTVALRELSCFDCRNIQHCSHHSMKPHSFDLAAFCILLLIL